MTNSAHFTSKIALVLADADGTLLTSEKVLTSEATTAVEELRAEGIEFRRRERSRASTVRRQQ